MGIGAGPPAPPVPEVLTSAEAAKLLRVSRRTLERLNIPSVRLGRLRRYLRQDILDWLRQKALDVEPGELFERERQPKRGK
jgi:excisionase family DNA binding protein